MEQGRVKTGIAGFHPGLQVELIPGTVHPIPDGMWSDDLFERVVVESPAWSGRRSRPATDVVKED